MASQNTNSELSNNLLQSQAHIWNHIFSFVKSMSLKCAVELEIPDIIDRHGSPMLLSQLVEALDIKQERMQFVSRLMRILVHSGFFVKQNIATTTKNDGEEEGEEEEEEEEGYSLAPCSRLLLKEHPLTLRQFLLLELDPILTNPWQDMSKWFRNDDVTPFQTTHGSSLWDLAGQEPKLNQLFNEAMANDARLVMSVVLEQCEGVFQGLDSIVDVGGGTGIVAKAIAKAFPSLSCICFDLPHVVKGLVGSDNMTYIGGDMFEAIPNANVVLLKWILHNWNDEECIKILKNCRDAIPCKERGGKLVIIDMVMKVDDGGNESLETQLFFDMLMMTCLTGRQRSETDWAKLFHNGGFSDYRIIPILGLRSLIEVYP